MRHSRVLYGCLIAFPLFLCTGCTPSSNKGKIERTSWRSLEATFRGMKLREGVVKLQFWAGNKVVFQVEDKTYNGKYTLGSGDLVTFEFEKEIAGRTTHHESIVIKGNKLTMIDSDGTQMIFYRD